MKKILAAFMLCATSVAGAEEVDFGNYNNAFGIDLYGMPGINYRYRVTETSYFVSNLHLYNFNDTIKNKSESNYINNEKSDEFRFSVGLRKYINRKKVSVFTEFKVLFMYEKSVQEYGITPDTINVSYSTKGIGGEVKMGGEYYVIDNFSIEGTLGIGALFTKAYGDNSGKRNSITTYDSGLSVNYYF